MMLYFLLAAAPVALSLTNAADYVATVPVNSNLIQGVGMGKDGAYRTVRAEDMEFLRTAFVERMYYAADPFSPGLDVSGLESARVPVKQWEIFWPGIVDLDFRLSQPESDPVRFRPGDDKTRSSSYGFVPASWEPWTGYLKTAGTNGWVRNGYDASTDIRAVFDSPNSDGISTNDVPRGSTNDVSRGLLIAGALSLATITNAYALIQGGLFDCILRSGPPRDDSMTTNAVSQYYEFSDAAYNYTSYSVGDYTGQYLSSLTMGADYSYTNMSSSVAGPSMTCSSGRRVVYNTPYGLEYTTAPTPANRYPGGIIHTLQPYRDMQIISESLPDAGGNWKVALALRRSSYFLPDSINTNHISVSAWLVCCWSCTTTDTWWTGAIAGVVDPSSKTTN
jgi:hypothetical protein